MDGEIKKEKRKRGCKMNRKRRMTKGEMRREARKAKAVIGKQKARTVTAYGRRGGEEDELREKIYEGREKAA